MFERHATNSDLKARMEELRELQRGFKAKRLAAEASGAPIQLAAKADVLKDNYVVQVDPWDCTKQSLCQLGTRIALAFCDVNGVNHPTAIHFGAENGGLRVGGAIAIYSPWTHAILANPKKMMMPVTFAGGRNWSFPGSKTDLTGVGVVCHEMGHHVDFMRNIGRNYANAIHEIVVTEPFVTPYEECHEAHNTAKEVIAEGLRLFMTNPELLREGRPKRFDFFSRVCGLRPLHSTPWREVLKHADAPVIRVMEKWISCS